MEGPGAMADVSPQTVPATIPQDLQFEISAYWDGGAAYLGPAGWDCTGVAGQNGSEALRITNPEARQQRVIYDLPGVSFEAMLDLACPIFPDARRTHDREFGRCTLEAPPTTTVVKRLSATAAVFTDPPDAAGIGTGSGHGLPAIGALVYLSQTSAKVTCLVPAGRARVCDSIAGVFAAQFGRT